MRRRLLAGALAILCGTGSAGLAQVIGEEAEMKRLERRAEDSIVAGDAEGAAMNMGKAALMAAQLAKRDRPEAVRHLFQGLERLFRAQEHAYRAVALFERAGGRPPASSSVCATIGLADREIAASGEILAPPASEDLDPPARRMHEHYQRVAAEWAETIRGLRADFDCRS